MVKWKMGAMCLLPGLLMLFSACSESEQKKQTVAAAKMPANTMQRNLDSAQISEGQRVFAKNCSGCHGMEAQGANNWRKPAANGKYPPPPLNGSGHAWHHSSDYIKGIIRNGSQPGQGNMPAWKDKLSNPQIDALVTWLLSRWPDAVYNAWVEMHGKK